MHFKMSLAQVRNEMETFDGGLEKFYSYCQAQFGTRQEKFNRRGRKPKKYLES